MLFYISATPILSGDSCYFNCGFILSALIMPTAVPAWSERKEQVLLSLAPVHRAFTLLQVI